MQIGGRTRIASQHRRVQHQAAPGAEVHATVDCDHIRALQLDLVEPAGLELHGADMSSAVGCRAGQEGGRVRSEGQDTVFSREWDRATTDRGIRILGTIVQIQPDGQAAAGCAGYCRGFALESAVGDYAFPGMQADGTACSRDGKGLHAHGSELIDLAPRTGNVDQGTGLQNKIAFVRAQLHAAGIQHPSLAQAIRAVPADLRHASCLQPRAASEQEMLVIHEPFSP